MTYPLSTASYRLRLRYGYSPQNGQLQSVRDADTPTTVFWTANTQNARGQVTQDTLGNGIVRSRAFDAITGWLSAIQAGPSGNTTALQNTSYLYDLVGNVTQRQNNRLSLTENFYYGNSSDNLYRLNHSTLTANGTTTTNLQLSYDALGNILTKNAASLGHATISGRMTRKSRDRDFAGELYVAVPAEHRRCHDLRPQDARFVDRHALLSRRRSLRSPRLALGLR